MIKKTINLHLQISIAYTKHFEASEEYISLLLSEADKNMYLDKEKYK